MTHLKRITRDPGVMGGKPCIRGLRVTVGTVIGLMAAGHSTADILAAYPYLEEEDLRGGRESIQPRGDRGQTRG